MFCKCCPMLWSFWAVIKCSLTTISLYQFSLIKRPFYSNISYDIVCLAIYFMSSKPFVRSRCEWAYIRKSLRVFTMTQNVCDQFAIFSSLLKRKYISSDNGSVPDRQWAGREGILWHLCQLQGARAAAQSPPLSNCVMNSCGNLTHSSAQNRHDYFGDISLKNAYFDKILE